MIHSSTSAVTVKVCYACYMKYQEAFDQTCQKRDEFWRRIGELDDAVIAPAVNPALAGGPAWPSLRQAYKVVHIPDGTILASDGLSDPYGNMDEIPENGKYQGLGLEFYLQTYDRLTPSAPRNWQTAILVNVAQFAAQEGALVKEFDDTNKYFSVSLRNPGLPKQFVHSEGYVGALLGLESKIVPRELDLPIQRIKLISVKLLTASELAYVMEHEEAGRNHVAELLLQQESGAYSTLTRDSVV